MRASDIQRGPRGVEVELHATLEGVARYMCCPCGGPRATVFRHDPDGMSDHDMVCADSAFLAHPDRGVRDLLGFLLDRMADNPNTYFAWRRAVSS